MLAGIVTLVWMLAFIALCVWAWRPARRAGFADAAMLAVDDDAQAAARDLANQAEAGR